MLWALTFVIQKAHSGWLLATPAPNAVNIARIFSLTNPTPTITASDFSSRHLAWNCRATNPNERREAWQSYPWWQHLLLGTLGIQCWYSWHITIVSALSPIMIPYCRTLRSSPHPSQRGRVVTDLLRLCFLLGESKLLTPSLRCPEKVDTDVSTLIIEINLATEKSTKFLSTFPWISPFLFESSKRSWKKPPAKQMASFSQPCFEKWAQLPLTHHQIRYFRCWKRTLQRLHLRSWSTPQKRLEGHQISSQQKVAHPISRLRRYPPLNKQRESQNLCWLPWGTMHAETISFRTRRFSSSQRT